MIKCSHRSPNVQLYSLSLAESLSKNCSVTLHREISSRAFTAGLEKLITDRNTHEKVKKKALVLVAMWNEEFAHYSEPGGDSGGLGVMGELYDRLKGKSKSLHFTLWRLRLVQCYHLADIIFRLCRLQVRRPIRPSSSSG